LGEHEYDGKWLLRCSMEAPGQELRQPQRHGTGQRQGVWVMSQSLSLNAFGKDVANLQSDLQKLDIQLPDAEVQRRIFGVGTRAAVLALQRRFGLEVTGTVDESTLRAIQDAVAVTDNSLGRVEGRVLTEDGAVARDAVIRLYRHTRD